MAFVKIWDLSISPLNSQTSSAFIMLMFRHPRALSIWDGNSIIHILMNYLPDISYPSGGMIRETKLSVHHRQMSSKSNSGGGLFFFMVLIQNLEWEYSFTCLLFHKARPLTHPLGRPHPCVPYTTVASQLPCAHHTRRFLFYSVSSGL